MGRMATEKKKGQFRSVGIRVVKYGVPVLMAAYLCLCIFMYPAERDSAFDKEECMLYYIVNADGMKGLGHSILMLVDEEGRGTVISFNGMQRTLGESLLGKSGVGKMSIGVMSADETESFLQSGNLCVEGDQLTDNYDFALYRSISTEEYGKIQEQITPYLKTEQEFTVLYEKWAAEENGTVKAEYKEALERLGEDENLPLYRIYTHNCDHAVRELISSIDTEMQEYICQVWRITPNGNLKAFGKKAEKWGIMRLGENTLPERILMFLMN